jgi:hypothetical protein
MAENAITTGTSAAGAAPASGLPLPPPMTVPALPASEPELPALLLLEPPPDTGGSCVSLFSDDVQATKTITKAAPRRSLPIDENPIVSG